MPLQIKDLCAYYTLSDKNDTSQITKYDSIHHLKFILHYHTQARQGLKGQDNIKMLYMNKVKKHRF